MQHNCTGPSTARFPSLEGVLTFLKLRYEEMELSRETCFEAPKCVHSLEALVLFHFLFCLTCFCKESHSVSLAGLESCMALNTKQSTCVLSASATTPHKNLHY